MRLLLVALVAAAAALMLGRRASRTDAARAPDPFDLDWLGEFRSPTNTITLDYPTNPAATWRN
jgi:hypothetical protein